MDDTEKTKAVWDSVFLADRREKSFMIQLYYIDDFFVEVFFDTAKNKVTSFNAFKSFKKLGPYLKDITIST